ncbi:MAG: long-chain-acyl-CoA synthetase [Gammaproteobacteria bacterium]|nr:long-chain-acyl-CoA synthetase [Gammaproteobacteria bacterium]
MGSIATFFVDLKILVTALTTKPPTSDTIGSVSLLVEQHARSHPQDVALLCEDEVITWKELNDRANRVARLLKVHGIVLGDCVSLFMQNRIEFVVQVLAVSKLGAIAGLINTNLTRQQLVHCITLTESKKCIFGEELSEPLNEIREELALKDGEDYLFVRDQGTQPLPNWAINLDSRDESIDARNHPESNTVTLGNRAFYIFTSGTTGLPKAAVVSNKRMLPPAVMSADALLRIKRTDRMYNCLPLYHGTGLMIGLTAAFHAGASTVIRRRLSISAFWDDIRKYNCTCFVYIGEFLRYLISSPKKSSDKDNPVRAIVGNGLRPDIWLDFKQRFDIERIGEFYGASEGNGGFANVFNKDCTVGLGIAPMKLVRYDVANDEIVRDGNGMCIEVEEGEPGLLLIEVTKKSEFEGYTDTEDSDKKLMRNAMREGDLYFNSGDLMKIVKVGFSFGQKHYQFVDRVGDTYRWKSENVSTNEVGEIINNYEDIIFTNIYGVEIPGTDGRAGMASIVFKEGLDADNINLSEFSAHVIGNLPGYARPVFIRILDELPTTTTHKLQKNDLREQAYHLDKVDNVLLVMRPGDTVYSKLDSDFYDKIIRREIAF